MLVLAINVGTQGARIVVCDPQDTVVARTQVQFAARLPSSLPAPGR